MASQPLPDSSPPEISDDGESDTESVDSIVSHLFSPIFTGSIKGEPSPQMIEAWDLRREANALAEFRSQKDMLLVSLSFLILILCAQLSFVVLVCFIGIGNVLYFFDYWVVWMVVLVGKALAFVARQILKTLGLHTLVDEAYAAVLRFLAAVVEEIEEQDKLFPLQSYTNRGFDDPPSGPIRTPGPTLLSSGGTLPQVVEPPGITSIEELIALTVYNFLWTIYGLLLSLTNWAGGTNNFLIRTRRQKIEAFVCQTCFWGARDLDSLIPWGYRIMLQYAALYVWFFTWIFEEAAAWGGLTRWRGIPVPWTGTPLLRTSLLETKRLVDTEILGWRLRTRKMAIWEFYRIWYYAMIVTTLVNLAMIPSIYTKLDAWALEDVMKYKRWVMLKNRGS